MTSLAVFLFSLSIVLFIGAAIPLPFWSIISLIFSMVGFSVIILFYTLNKFYTDKEAIN